MKAAATEKEIPREQIDAAWAWTRYQPDARRPWDLRLAGHLYRRAAFGASWEQLDQAVRQGPQRSIDQLLKPDADVAALNRTYDELESAVDPDSQSTDSLRGWWLRRILETPHPLLEKLTLFWHNHFATSGARNSRALAMHRHVQTLRTHALGRFSELFAPIVTDAATLLALDAAANHQAQPNLSLGRDVLELFSVGPGNFSNDDARGVARALTGWFVTGNQVRYVAREHDEGRKTILGQEGPWASEDVVRIVVGQPATSRRIVRKLYRWLISETHEPNDALIAPLADAFASDHDIGKLVETMLRSNLFFSPVAYRRRVKSPVEFALGIVRGLEVLVNTEPLGHALAELGQNICHPPTAHGWAGGAAWINQATIIGRSNLAWDLLSASSVYGEKSDPGKVAQKHGHSSLREAGHFFADLYLQDDASPAARQSIQRLAAAAHPDADRSKALRELVHAIVTLPEFQLA